SDLFPFSDANYEAFQCSVIQPCAHLSGSARPSFRAVSTPARRGGSGTVRGGRPPSRAHDHREHDMTDAVPGFDVSTFTHGGRTHEVYTAGTGSAVVVVHEMPGLHPGVTKFGQRLVDAGYRVYPPSLFGRPGAPFGGGEMLRTLRQVCVSREFHLLADRTPPVVTWLRALAAQAHTECGGPGVGAVGMCFTGGYALAMAVEPAVLAPVLSQPGIPAPLTSRKRSALGLDPADLASVKTRTSDGLCVLGLRFSD